MYIDVAGLLHSAEPFEYPHHDCDQKHAHDDRDNDQQRVGLDLLVHQHGCPSESETEVDQIPERQEIHRRIRVKRSVGCVEIEIGAVVSHSQECHNSLNDENQRCRECDGPKDLHCRTK